MRDLPVQIQTFCIISRFKLLTNSLQVGFKNKMHIIYNIFLSKNFPPRQPFELYFALCEMRKNLIQLQVFPHVPLFHPLRTALSLTLSLFLLYLTLACHFILHFIPSYSFIPLFVFCWKACLVLYEYGKCSLRWKRFRDCFTMLILSKDVALNFLVMLNLYCNFGEDKKVNALFSTI